MATGSTVKTRVVVASLCALLVSPPLFAQASSPEPLGAQTRPVSPSVLATIIERSSNIELLVLWRGHPGWFLAGGRRGAKYSGGQTGFSAALEYGGIDLGLLYEPARHAATVQGKAVELPAGTNVILIDNVDSADGPRFVESLAIDGHLDASADPTMASILARSPGIVAFLRCEIGTPEETTTRMLSSLACDDLKRH